MMLNIDYGLFEQCNLQNKTESDRYVYQQLSKVFTGMSGRYTRLRIIKQLTDSFENVNSLSKILDLDYKTVQRNIEILEKHNMIVPFGEKYGTMYYLSPFLEKNVCILYEIIQKTEKKFNRKKNYI